MRPLVRFGFSAEEKLRPRPGQLRLKVSPLGVPLPSLVVTLAKRFLPSNGARPFQPLQTALSGGVLHKHNGVTGMSKTTEKLLNINQLMNGRGCAGVSNGVPRSLPSFGLWPNRNR